MRRFFLDAGDPIPSRCRFPRFCAAPPPCFLSTSDSATARVVACCSSSAPSLAARLHLRFGAESQSRSRRRLNRFEPASPRCTAQLDSRVRALKSSPQLVVAARPQGRPPARSKRARCSCTTTCSGNGRASRGREPAAGESRTAQAKCSTS